MNITEFREKYATNDHRINLFASFEKFIENAEEYLSPFSIAIYGSYITEKDNPSDIDIILHGFVKNEKFDTYNPALFRLESPIHIKAFISQSFGDKQLKNMNKIISEFSSSEENKKKNFRVDSYVEIVF